MTVGFYAPLPPAPTGVADYAAALLPALRRLGAVQIAPERCDVGLYHLGNNRQHAEIYRRALTQPGVVVLHDAVLHHFLLGELDETRYLDEFAYNYGDWNRGLGEDLWRNRATAGSDNRYFQYPMLKRLAESARAIIVHNPGAAHIATAHARKTPIIEIPHLFEPPERPSATEVAEYRRCLGFASDAYVFGVFGYIRETKRLIPILQTFAAIRQENSRIGLLVAGAFASPELERAAELWLAEPGVTRLPFLPVQDFWRAAAAVDACINLRYPGAGETSGIGISLMGIGKPVLLTASEENAGFPEDSCIRIPSGLAERDSLRRHMLLLPSIQGFSGEIGRRAADHIRAQHSLESIARLYWDTLCEYSS